MEVYNLYAVINVFLLILFREAEATRNALHGVYWPIGNGKQLVIDYATLEDMEKAKNPTPPMLSVNLDKPEKENRVRIILRFFLFCVFNVIETFRNQID